MKIDMDFRGWINEVDAWNQGIEDAIGGLGGAFKAGAEAKALEYAKRIISGEDPNVVLQGMKPNGAVWTAVMAMVEKLKGGDQGQISISGIEQKLGIQPGSLDLQSSKTPGFVFVRNRLTGKSVSVKPDPKEIENAARQLFGLTS